MAVWPRVRNDLSNLIVDICCDSVCLIFGQTPLQQTRRRPIRPAGKGDSSLHAVGAGEAGGFEPAIDLAVTFHKIEMRNSVQAKPGERTHPPKACSMRWAIWMQLRSLNSGTTTSAPTGSPDALRPRGMVVAVPRRVALPGRKGGGACDRQSTPRIRRACKIILGCAPASPQSSSRFASARSPISRCIRSFSPIPTG